MRGFAPQSRRRSLKIAFGRRNFGIVARVKAIAAVVAPRATGRYLERLERTTGRSRLARRTHGR